MSIVQQDEYTTPQQEEDKRFTGVNEFGNVVSTLGQIGMLGLAMSRGGGFGKNKQSAPKGMGKPRISTTGIPQSQFSASGLSRKRSSIPDLQMRNLRSPASPISPTSPSERVARIGLTRSARNPYGPLRVRSDPVGDFAKRLGRQAGKAATATKKAAVGVAKKVRGQYRKLTADPFKATNVFAGKGPNEMRERNVKYKPSLPARRHSTPARRRGVPTPFTQAGYRTV